MGNTSPRHSGINAKWMKHGYVARMKDAYMFAGIIEIRDAFKECCILNKEGMRSTIEYSTVL